MTFHEGRTDLVAHRMEVRSKGTYGYYLDKLWIRSPKQNGKRDKSLCSSMS